MQPASRAPTIAVRIPAGPGRLARLWEANRIRLTRAPMSPARTPRGITIHSRDSPSVPTTPNWRIGCGPKTRVDTAPAASAPVEADAITSGEKLR